MPELDELLGHDEHYYYMNLGSGIKGVGPRIVTTTGVEIHSVPAAIASPLNYLDLFAHRTGSLRRPWYDTSLRRQHGYRGRQQHFHLNPHWTMFGLGSVSRHENGSVALDLDVTASIDWANFYAATTFNDTKLNRRVIWCWSDKDMNGWYRCARLPGITWATS